MRDKITLLATGYSITAVCAHGVRMISVQFRVPRQYRMMYQYFYLYINIPTVIIEQKRVPKIELKIIGLSLWCKP